MATTPVRGPATGEADVQATEHDVGHAKTIGTGPVTAGASGTDGYTLPRDPEASVLEPGSLVGEYRVERKIGEGGMGVVYGAVHPLIGKRVAIKVLSLTLCMQPAAVDRFIQEARAVNQIGHPNIVDIFSFGNLPDGRSYFVMEWLEGKSLAERLRKGRPTLAETCAIVEEIAVALEAAHAKRIIHRDLKPDNVFLLPSEGRPKIKLLDFGIAKLLDDSGERITKTRTGSLMGTPLYVAPEQARGYEIDGRVDVYSLGCVACELLTGQPPFVADNAMDVVAQHLNDAPPAPSSRVTVPRELDALVVAMLSKAPDGRPSFAEIRRVLASVVATPVAAATPVPARAGAGRAGTWAALAAGVAAAGGLGVYALGGGGGSTAAPPSPSPVAAAAPTPDAAPAPDRVAASTFDAAPAPASTPTVLVLEVDARDAVARIDGVEHRVPRRGLRLEVTPGPHAVSVRAPGRVAVEQTFDAEPSKVTLVSLQLEKARRRDGGAGRPTTPAGTTGGSSAGTTTGTAAVTPPDDDAVVDPFHRKRGSGAP